MNVLPQITQFKRVALDLFFPRRCVSCGKGGAFICSACLIAQPRIAPPLCPRCGRPQPSGNLCPGCISWQPEIDAIRSPFLFDGVIRQAIYQFKYRNLRAVTPTLVELMASYMTTESIPGDVLVPVPLHGKRLRERGYNQSGLISKELGKRMNIPVIEDCLTRQRHTLPQARTASVEERKNNIVDAFICTDERPTGKKIILIDDVATSGLTLDACAAALKEAGAVSVWGVVLAREI